MTLAKRPLTDRSITALKPAPSGKRMLVWDAIVPGLAVRVTDRGAKSFVLVARFGGSVNPTARAIGKVGDDACLLTCSAITSPSRFS